MSEKLSAETLQNEVAVSLASVVASANKGAHTAGLKEASELLNISLRDVDGENVWAVTYGPRQTFTRRGGGLIIFVNPDDNSIVRVLHGQ